MTRTYATSGEGTGGGVAGNDKDIQFNASGVQAGNDNLVFDYTNKRVGIGTATPKIGLELVDPIGIQVSQYGGTRNIDAGSLIFKVYLNATNFGGSQIFSYYTGDGGGGHGLAFYNTNSGYDGFSKFMTLDDFGQLVLYYDPAHILYPAGFVNFVCPSMSLAGVLKDGAGSVGTSGQVLSSTGTSTQWVTAGSSSGFQRPLSGTVDGTNATFTWTLSPNVLAVDGGKILQRVQSDTTVNWTVSGTGPFTTVLSVPPNFDIFATA